MLNKEIWCTETQNIMSNQKKANYFRHEIFKKFCEIDQGHPGSIFSIIDFLTCLYFSKILKKKKNKILDKVIMSKGHATSGQFPILRDLGIIKKKEWENWGKNNKTSLRIFGNNSIPGIDVTTGSLGLGIGVGAGLAYANRKINVYCIISEGELYEGSTWETLLFINHYKLFNFKLIIDVNKLIILGKTKDCLTFDNIAKKISSFGFKTHNINGHNFSAINKKLKEIKNSKKLDCLILNTIKGKGLKLMENKAKWHYWNPLTDDQKSNNIKILEKSYKK